MEADNLYGARLWRTRAGITLPESQADWEEVAADATGSPPAGPGDVLYLSASTNGTVAGLYFANEDILRYDSAANQWSLYFDGSDVGLAAVNVDAFDRQADGTLLLSFEKPLTLPGLGLVDDSDIVRFTPASLGANTAGTFSLYLSGAAAGLSANSEDIDALAFAGDQPVVSTLGQVSVPGATGQDEDLLRYDPAANAWQVYFDGSDVGLTNAAEDIWGVWIDPASGEIFLSTQGAFAVAGASGAGSDILLCTPIQLGNTTACTFSLYWEGLPHGFDRIIDALDIERSP